MANEGEERTQRKGSERDYIERSRRRGGYRETSALLPQDERFISKNDRDPYAYVNEDSGGVYTVESCSPYTLAYWLGRYFKFLEEAQA